MKNIKKQFGTEIHTGINGAKWKFQNWDFYMLNYIRLHFSDDDATLRKIINNK